MGEKCFCHFNGYEVKDAVARKAANENAAALSKTANAVSLMTDRKFIFIGDSYAAGSQLSDGEIAWPEYVRNKLGLIDGTNFWKFALGGSSFGVSTDSEYNFIRQAENAVAALTEKVRSQITDIVVGGGANDWQYDADAIFTGMNDFNTYCRTYFPNAKIHLFAIGWMDTPQYRRGLQGAYYRYGLYSGNFLWAFYNGLWRSIHNDNRMSADMIHPNQSGHVSIGNGVVNAILGGNALCDPPLQSDCVLVSGSEIKSIGKAHISGDDLYLRTIAGTVNLSESVTLGTSWAKIGELDCYQIFGCDINQIPNSFQCQLVLNGATANPVTANAHLQIRRNGTGSTATKELWCRIYENDGTGWGNYSVSSISFVDGLHVIPLWCA